MTLQLRELSYPLGAEVIGVDIRKPLDERALKSVRRALCDNCVVLFRGIPLTQGQYVAFARQLGEPDDNRSRKTRNPEYPEISGVINKLKPDGTQAEGYYAGADWHSDGSFRVSPTLFSMLHAIEIPEVGGDTEFANMYLAYESLSEGMKRLIDGLQGVHMQEERLLDHSSPERLEAARRAMTIAHPLVKVHPETGRKALYVGDKVMLFAGMTPEESRPLLDFLRAHSRRPQFVYRHVWQKGDLVIWDNRCTNHNALGNFDRARQNRHLDKISVLGPQTGYVYEDKTQTRNLTLAM